MLGSRRRRERPRGDDFFYTYGLTKNPFPPARTIIPEVMYNQEPALRKFATAIESVADLDAASRRSLAVLGGSGSGKTHFLRHCQFLFDDYIKNDIDCSFVIIEFQAGTSSSSSLVRDILRRADEVCARQGEYDFVTAIINSEPKKKQIGAIKLPDLRNAVECLLRASEPSFVPKDKDGKFNFEHLRDVMRKWITGGTLTPAERENLNVSSRLATSSIMIRVMTELFSFARSQDVIHGVLICLDELEALFASGVSTAKIQSFLQDVRYLFDESLKENNGYSLFIISASSQKGASDLRDYNYPLFQRLGFEEDSREELQPVRGYIEARNFANVYIDHERDIFEKDDSGMKSVRYASRSIVSDEDIMSALKRASPKRLTLTREPPVSQAQLLEALHSIVEEKRNNAS